jgi:hypothetical protein
MLRVAEEFTMDQHKARTSFWKTPFGVIATLIALAASVYLYVAHKDHVLALLPFAFLAACPLMHILMHRGHSHGGHSHGESRNNDGPRDGQGR